MVASTASRAESSSSTAPTTLTPSSVPATTSKPHSFSISALHADNFDPQAFIAERRQHAPLSLVRDELRTYAGSLSSQIVHALQKDFNLFTNFGPSLSDATLLAQCLAPAFTKLRSNLESLHNHLQSHAETLDAALAHRHAIHNRRLALQTLVSVHDSLAKCERLLRQFTPLSSDPLSESALSLLDRITAEAAQLSFTLARAQTSAFLDALAIRISSVKRQLRTSLDQCLKRALPFPRQFDSDILARVLSLYVVAGMQSDAHAFFTRHVVTPFVSQRLRMGVMLAVAERSQRKSEAPVTPGDALRAAHDEIVSFLGDRVLPLVSLCQSDTRLARRLDFVGASVWPNVQRAISTHMAPTFSPGIPDVFHGSFRAGVDIFSAVEAAASDHFRVALRSSSTTSEFWRHWNLPVYFQLRFQEIASTFESLLRDGPVIAIGTTASASKTEPVGESRLLRTDVYRAAATCGLVAALKRCWTEDVFLTALTHRFVRLSLQLLARYATWVRTGLAGEWTDDEHARGTSRVVHDVSVLQTRIPAELASVLSTRCTSLSTDAVDGIESAFAEAVERYAALIPDLVNSIADCLSRKCVENLQPLRGIIATYRMSSKQAATTHSSFVPKILRPLRMFLKEDDNRLDGDVRQKITKSVVEETGKEYLAMATDLVERNKNNEATLKRLNIGRGGGGGGGGGGASGASGGSGGGGDLKSSSGMSVVEKISVQMFLDVEQFSDEVRAVGVVVEGVESLQTLRGNVQKERDSFKQGGNNSNNTKSTSTSANQ